METQMFNWLSKLKKGDIVHSRYPNARTEPLPYEFLELYTGSLVESGVGAYLLVNGEPKLLDSFWLELL